MSQGDTIVALSSGALPAGIAVVRVSGPATAGIVRALAGALPAPRRLTLAVLRSQAQILDRGMVAWFPAPGSFTGEDCAEFQVHGSRAVIRALLRALGTIPGVRLAEAGEFTRRAFENGKLDLTAVEGLGDLIEAETEGQRRQALERLGGRLTLLLQTWRERLLDARAEIEAQLDFSDEGDVGELPPNFPDALRSLRQEIEAAAASVGRGRLVREGVRVAIAGPPNAGKSSLLNALSDSEVAIVTDEPGTTRDVRELPIDLGGQLVVLIDMAGLRATSSKAEAEGVRRAAQEIASADLVLWLQAPDAAADEALPPTANCWRIATKSDLGPSPDPSDLAISVRTGAGVGDLLVRLEEFCRVATGDGESLVVSRERDRVALVEAATALAEAEATLGQAEVAAEALRRGAQALARLMGKMDAEDVLDRLFSAFCIGK